MRGALEAMLGARRVAVVGASATPHSFGHRLLSELGRSPSRPEIYPVNPRYGEIDGRACLPSLADLDRPVDLVALAVGDSSLEAQLRMAADRGDRSAVIFGSIVDVETSAPDRRGRTPKTPTTRRAVEWACVSGWRPSRRTRAWHCAAVAAWAS